MSKQLQVVCVLLLAGIFVIQLMGFLSSRRPVALRSNAMMRNIEGERDLSGSFSGGSGGYGDGEGNVNCGPGYDIDCPR